MRALLLLAATAACLAVASAQRSTVNQRYMGFTMGSEVVGYTNMTLDYCDIGAAINAGNLTAALDLYQNGKNSMSGSGFRKYLTWSSAAHPGEQTYDLLLAYHSPDGNSSWLDTKIRAAFAAGRAWRALSLIHVVVNFKYALHEVDSAWFKVTNGTANHNNITTGAPHNLDEAWTIYAGAHPEQCSTPLLTSDRLGVEMGTRYAGRSLANYGIAMAMSDMHHAALLGNTTEGLATISAARAAMHYHMVVYHAQGLMRAAYASELKANCGRAQRATDNKDIALSYWDALAPVLTLLGTPEAELSAVDTALAAEPLVYRDVAVAAKAAVRASGVTLALGEPSFSRINDDKSCARANAPQE